MIYVIHPQFFAYSSKIVNPFTKYQLRSLGSEVRVCTIMSDADAGQNIDCHNVNIRSRESDAENGKTVEVLVRSSSHNKYDGNVIIAAIPFNGVLLPTHFANYRFRYAEVVEMRDTHKGTEEKFYPEGLCNITSTTEGLCYAPDKILYCVLEPNTAALTDVDHPRFASQIHINIPFAEYDKDSDRIISNTNFRICITESDEEVAGDERCRLNIETSYAPRHMIPKVMSKLKKDCLKQYENPLGTPYEIFIGKKDKESKKTDEVSDDEKPAKSKKASKPNKQATGKDAPKKSGKTNKKK